MYSKSILMIFYKNTYSDKHLNKSTDNDFVITFHSCMYVCTIYYILFEVERFCGFHGLIGNRKTFPLQSLVWLRDTTT